jgi:hypothetical protein
MSCRQTGAYQRAFIGEATTIHNFSTGGLQQASLPFINRGILSEEEKNKKRTKKQQRRGILIKR